MTRNDITGDGSADIVVTSPWGIGVLGVDGPAMVEKTMAPNGTRFGEWLLNTNDNNVELRADVDGDGTSELLMSSPWGIGLLKMVNGSLRSIAMGQNGKRFGGWIIDTSNNQFLHAGDVDGDGRDEILITSPWGIGFLKYDGGFTTLMLQPNGTRFGGWLLNTADNSFPLLADVDGDGRQEVVVTSSWGLGVLKFASGTLTSIVMAPNGTSFGGWTLNTATDSIEVAADLNGDGRAELLVRGPAGLAVLRFDAGALHTIATATPAANLGGWQLNPVSDKLGIAGDFDGDGSSEILVSSDWGLGILKLVNGALTASLTAANGTRFGGWLLNTRDNRLDYVADFDGDGRSELMISSPWGIGVLEQSGATLAPITMSPNGTRFGGWLLNTADNDLEAGLGQSYGLLIWHPDWTGAVTNTDAFLRGRGFTVFSTQDVQTGLRELRRLALTLRANDRVFVYLAGHGATYRPVSDVSQSSAGLHILQFGDGSVVQYSEFSPWFKRMGAIGADVTVFDGSCDGGEAVMDAIGTRYLALSTTSIHAPGITNTPDPSNMMSKVGRPNSFGMWWSREQTASLMTSQMPHRFYQKLYRSDDTDINRWSLIYKPGITFFQSVGGSWDLFTRGCYLYRYVYPEVYATFTPEQKAGLTVKLDVYLAAMRAGLNDYTPSITALRGMLNDASAVQRAADVYAAAYPTPWRTMFGDLGWNVDAEPVRNSPTGTPIEPRAYAGRDGFLRMVAQILGTLSRFEQSYEEQERLLRQLDAALWRRRIVQVGLTTEVIKKPIKVTDYLEFNEFDLGDRLRTQRVVDAIGAPALRVAERMDALRTPLAFEEHREPLAPLEEHVLHGGEVRLRKHGALDGVLHGGVVQLERKRPDLSALFDDEITAITPHIPIELLHPSIDDIVARLRAIQVADYVMLDRLFYLLTIAEESISRATAKGVEVGDLVSF